MKKAEQIAINEDVKGFYADMQMRIDCYGHGRATKLYSCQAEYFRTNGYIVLRSYDTIIACIDIDDWVCYDFLRLVYGYTATSAQHISKFCRRFNVLHKVTYYPV